MTMIDREDAVAQANGKIECPPWCEGGCRGNHWREISSVAATEGRGVGADYLGVHVHFDRESLGGDRPQEDMDPRPHVLVHVFGDEGELDADARFTAADARELARYLIDAADMLERVTA